MGEVIGMAAWIALWILIGITWEHSHPTGIRRDNRRRP
jgi:hypothetical protein